MIRPAQKKNSALLTAALLAALLTGACLGLGHKKTAEGASSNAAPDTVLYDRAMNDIRHGRYTVARLTLQTLINTYPDSEYLAKAKLAIADSFFKEGGTSGLTQSVSEYKDFITFFPFLDEASYAQMQVAMAHYRMMQKPDRDRTQAEEAEQELQTFLLKYPQSPLAPQAAQRLREVQEVLAEGDYRVAHFYYLRQAYRSAAARLLELTDRYPLYSQADKANWMLAEIYQKVERNDLAAKYYAHVVREYPLSGLAGDAKKRLAALGVPVPQPDPVALARMERERDTQRERAGLMRRSVGFLKSGPDVSTAARYGEPNLNPPAEVTSATEVLQPRGTSTIVAGGGTGGATTAATTSPAGAPSTGSSVAVETVPAGSSPSSASAPAEGTSPSGVSVSPSTSNTPSASSSASAGSNGASTGSAANASGTQSAAATKPASDSSGSSDPTDKKNSKKKEPSSKKKKKGLRKIIPW